jgi:hypothetical protein
MLTFKLWLCGCVRSSSVFDAHLKALNYQVNYSIFSSKEKYEVLEKVLEFSLEMSEHGNCKGC